MVNAITKSTEEPGETVEMISVKVGDEDLTDLAGLNTAPLQLDL